MSKLRVAAAATAVSLIGAFASMGPANAATTKGIGTTQTSSSLVDVALGTAGNLLHVRVLGDDSKTTVDPAVGPTSALTQLFGVKISSSLLPALNLTLPNPSLESKSPGGNGNVTGSALNFSSLPLASLPLGILTGALDPSTLTSAVDTTGAHSGLSASLLNLGLVGGLLDVNSVSSTLGTLAGTAEANGAKGFDVGAVSVLNLGALLKGLGIDMTKLPLGSVSALVSQLDVGSLVQGLPAGGSLGTVVSNLLTTVTDLTGQSGVLSSLPAAGTLLPTLNGLLGGLPLGGNVLAGGALDSTKTVSALLASVNGLLTQVLGSALDILDNVSLLKLNGLHIGSTVKSASTKEASKSDVVGTLGSIGVGGLTLPGLDLSSTLATVTGLTNNLNGILNGVLGALAPQLNGLLSVKFFDKKSDNGVTTSGGYVRSLAGITGLGVSVGNLTQALQGVIDGLGSTAGIGGLLSTAGGAGALSSVTGLLGGQAAGGILNTALGTVASLAGGASIKLADVSSGSNFAVPVASTPVSPVSQLPRTGANTTIFLLVGLLMVGGVIVGRRYIPVMVSTKK
jgi:LPXTG-motif cell wall-anchored protein